MRRTQAQALRPTDRGELTMNMNDALEFDDELLSAYLDGELSAEERARVEAHLAADPQARKLFDELRGVSLAMRELPPATPLSA